MKKQVASRSLAADSLNVYLNQIKAIPLLTIDAERSLAMRNDDESRRRLVEANLRLVVKMASRYRTYPIMDLIQEGNLGLIHAAEKFDYSKNVKFSTYAGLWIRHYLKRAMFKERSISIPQRHEELSWSIEQVRPILTQALERSPSIEELAYELGVSPEHVMLTGYYADQVASLDAPIRDDSDTTLGDTYADTTYDPVEELLAKSTRSIVAQMKHCLSERERDVINLRYPTDSEKRSYKKVSEMIGLSIEACRQIEIRAMKKLQSYAEHVGFIP